MMLKETLELLAYEQLIAMVYGFETDKGMMFAESACEFLYKKYNNGRITYYIRSKHYGIVANGENIGEAVEKYNDLNSFLKGGG